MTPDEGHPITGAPGPLAAEGRRFVEVNPHADGFVDRLVIGSHTH